MHVAFNYQIHVMINRTQALYVLDKGYMTILAVVNTDDFSVNFKRI